MTVFLIWISVLSLLSFLFYGVDKRRAIRGRWRISEKLLLTLGFVGGAAGALLAMKLFRHKTKHAYFWFWNITGLLLHIALFVFLVLPS